MKLNKDTKHDVKAGDIIRFSYGDEYRVTTVIDTGRAVSYTLRDLRYGRVLYSYPSSQCYGADVVRGE